MNSKRGGRGIISRSDARLVRMYPLLSVVWLAGVFVPGCSDLFLILLCLVLPCWDPAIQSGSIL